MNRDPMRHCFALLLAFACLPPTSSAQGPASQPDPLRRSSIPAPPTPGGQTPVGPPRLPAGVTREQMWPAPTEQDWQKPCLVPFQRTWDDALAAARDSHKPILVCINMDGEIASEHYAGVRYRQPETARLYEPYVCVIASVYRHTPRDYDDQGRRILCPRFGSVTCGEHIWIEPVLYEKFMEGRRIAPRHICVETGEPPKETFDVFYTWDTASVFQTIRAGAADRPPPTPPSGDRSLVQRVASRDAADRLALETAYVQGTAAVRRQLLEAALTHRELDHVDLLRLALFGLDAELAQLARRALAQCETEAAIDLIGEALRVPMAQDEREMLIAALERLGHTFPRARTLAAVYRGLASQQSALDVNGWNQALARANAATPPDRATLETRVSYQARAAEADPRDVTSRLGLAESYLALAGDPRTPRRFAQVMLEDARTAARQARDLGAQGWRVHAALALTAFRLGDRTEAYAQAERAVAGQPADAQDLDSMLVVALFAEGRQAAIWQALREHREWPAQWLTDVKAAYSVLARHPLGTDQQVAAHVDFLQSLHASAQAATVLEEGLKRFPESWVLHDRLRARVLAEKGADGLEAAYAERLARSAGAANQEWFAGYAAIVAAEFARRGRKPEPAVAAYERAIGHYQRARAANPDSHDSCDHYLALALAGRARIELERGDLDRALASLLEALQRRPDSAASLDGLNLSPVDTAKMLRARLVESQRSELVAKLDAALAALDPRLLELPAYEREVPPESRPQGRPRRGRRGG